MLQLVKKVKLISSDYCRFTDSLIVHDNLLIDCIFFALTAPIRSVHPPLDVYGFLYSYKLNHGQYKKHQQK